ncbi:mrna-decapping enzyme subunit 2 [Moniliophthora roreri]|uniref:Nudix hydrolase domain-containing protein n=1 Tax=Moniliophthora roreri TaxID=221103 RepID=A0A0W0G3B6_MONRR|nr:mrna-decapping enzyme subunit 2 [Moniliophthora roreri]
MSSSSSSSPEISPAIRPDSPHERFSYKYATHEDVLEDFRFILNLPEEELASLERICFQVEQAHWFYEDFIREANPKFPSLPLKKFSAMLFHSCPLLHQWSHAHEQAFTNFMQYKTRVPVCGAIMLNETWEKCLLVKGWKSSSGWGFPKGKINEDELQPACAVREVLEETGYNLAGQINPEDVIEMSIREQKIALYIVPGVPEDYPFKTKTRKEISKIEWFRLADLPTWKRNKAAAGKFYLITPFISALKVFIHDRKPRNIPRKPPKSKRPQGIDSSPSVHESAAADSPYTTYQDAHQESSSQSSSADNGDPQTPSPQCPPSMANHVDVVSTETESMDPHFARLLSSLTMSGAAKEKQSESALPKHTRDEALRERNTPMPTALTNTEPRSQPAVEAKAFTSPSNGKTKDVSSSSSSFVEQVHSSQSVTALSPARSVFESPPLTKLHGNGPSPSATSSATSQRPLTSRRTSSVADISPYLSKTTEIPSSAKRLRQLALLESVADESARMSPYLALREMAASRMTPNPLTYPGPPASVPPQLFGPADPNVIYSSGPGAMPPSDANLGHIPPRPFIQDDPFQVRPRTSHAVNRPLYHQSPPASMSMNQSQLLALMSASTPPQSAQPSSYVSPIPPYQRPNVHGVPPLPSLYPTVPAQPLRQGAFTIPVQSPLNHMVVPPPPQLSASPAYGQANSLLSILNGQRR